jgi:hypothetical protein
MARLYLLPLSASTLFMAVSEYVTVSESSACSRTIKAVRSFVMLAGGYSTWLFWPKIMVPESTSIRAPASAWIPVSDGQSGRAKAVMAKSWQNASTLHSNFFVLCFTWFLLLSYPVFSQELLFLFSSSV